MEPSTRRSLEFFFAISTEQDHIITRDSHLKPTPTQLRQDSQSHPFVDLYKGLQPPPAGRLRWKGMLNLKSKDSN